MLEQISVAAVDSPNKVDIVEEQLDLTVVEAYSAFDLLKSGFNFTNALFYLTHQVLIVLAIVDQWWERRMSPVPRQ